MEYEPRGYNIPLRFPCDLPNRAHFSFLASISLHFAPYFALYRRD